MRSIVDTGKRVRKFAGSATPQFQNNPTAPTARDYSTSALAGAVTVLLVAALHHGAQIDLSPEVVAALTTILGFMAARYFRY